MRQCRWQPLAEALPLTRWACFAHGSRLEGWCHLLSSHRFGRVAIGFLHLPESLSTGTLATEPPGVLCPRRPLCHVHPHFSSCTNTDLLASRVSAGMSSIVSFQTNFLLLPFVPTLDLCVSQNVVLRLSGILFSPACSILMGDFHGAQDLPFFQRTCLVTVQPSWVSSSFWQLLCAVDLACRKHCVEVSWLLVSMPLHLRSARRLCGLHRATPPAPVSARSAKSLHS